MRHETYIPTTTSRGSGFGCRGLLNCCRVLGRWGCVNLPDIAVGNAITIFVYCDLIGPQIVCDTLTRCFRTIFYPYPDGYHIFDKVYYVPVEKSEFQIVAIEVLTKLGDLVPLPDTLNPLVAILHFRRRV
jgi:hypothetical protein